MALPEFTLERYFAKWEFTAPYLLCCSDIEGWRMADLLALADEECRERWENLTLGYTESSGLPSLRQEIARIYSRIEAGDVLTFGGAQEGLLLTLQAMAGPGDHAIVTWPCYQSTEEAPRGAGAEVSRWELRAEDGWKPDVARLRTLIRPNTKLIAVNFPHNPTGALPDPDTWAEIVSLARDCGAWLFSDEVYRESEYDPAHRLAAGADVYDRGVSLGVMSKTYALAGLRIGWIATRDRDLLRRVAGQKDYTTITNSAPSEILALIALRERDRVIARSMEILQTNLPLLDAFFARWQERLEWVRPHAGPIGFPKLTHSNIDEFSAQLVSAEGVLLLPASVYGHTSNHFRLGFGRTNMPAALERFDRFLSRS